MKNKKLNFMKIYDIILYFVLIILFICSFKFNSDVGMLVALLGFMYLDIRKNLDILNKKYNQILDNQRISLDDNERFKEELFKETISKED